MCWTQEFDYLIEFVWVLEEGVDEVQAEELDSLTLFLLLEAVVGEKHVAYFGDAGEGADEGAIAG